jgi:hypothetical protein
MALNLLSMAVFWTWNALQPTAAPVAPVVPTKVILHATWIEPVALRDETSLPMVRGTAGKKPVRVSKPILRAATQKQQKPLWKAAKSWEMPPILWAGFEAFVAAGLGIVSLLGKGQT